MASIRHLLLIALTATLFLGGNHAWAHCDGLGGPGGNYGPEDLE